LTKHIHTKEIFTGFTGCLPTNSVKAPKVNHITLLLAKNIKQVDKLF